MGGALFIYSGTVNVNNSVFQGNQAIGGNGTNTGSAGGRADSPPHLVRRALLVVMAPQMVARVAQVVAVVSAPIFQAEQGVSAAPSSP